MATSPSFDPADPAWLAHRYDLVGDRVRYRHVPRSLHREGPFLIDELIGNQPQHVLERASGVAVARRHMAPVHFIFHSAFCASTMLVRAFDLSGAAMGLSEPVLLNDIVGIHRRGERGGADLARLIDEALTLLGRPWSAGEAVVIKPSNILCTLQRPILALRPQARAVLLHAPLRPFLASVARKGLWCRLWVRELLEGLLHDGLVDLGLAAKDYFRLTDLQIAAVGWLAQHRQFAMLADLYPERVRSLASSQLLADPEGVATAVADLFGIEGRFAGHPAFGRHSKSGTAFTAGDRALEERDALTNHADEIEKVEAWATVLAERAGVALTLPNPLIA